MVDIKVNDQYWLDKGHEYIDGSVKRIETQVSSLRSYVNTIEVPYTIAAIAEAIFLDLGSYWPICVIALAIPIAILEYAKWHLTVVYVSDKEINEPLKIDPRNPNMIKRAYTEIFTRLIEALKKAKKMSFVAVVVLILSLVGNAAWSGVISNSKNKLSDYYLSVDMSSDSEVILFSGRFPVDEKIELSSYLHYTDSTSMNRQEFLIGSEGLFFHSTSNLENVLEMTFVVKYENKNEAGYLVESLGQTK